MLLVLCWLRLFIQMWCFDEEISSVCLEHIQALSYLVEASVEAVKQVGHLRNPQR